MNKYTHKIDKEFNNILLDGAEIGTDSNWKPITKIIPKQMNEANEYLVKAMTGKSQDEIDNMWVEEFNKLLSDIQKLKDGNESKKKNS
jgi:hypothetical protein